MKENEKAANALKKKDLEFSRSEKIDNLFDRYQILASSPIPELNTGFSKAYEIEDRREELTNIYAAVLDSTIPARISDINALNGKTISNMCNIIDFAIVQVSSDNQFHMVLIIQKPKGKKLSELLLEIKSPNEDFITKKVILPITNLIKTLNMQSIGIGRINHDNIYIGNSPEETVIGDFISEPCGYSQYIVYETLERSANQPIGKGGIEKDADYYALGILVAYILLQNRAQIFGDDMEKVVEQKLTKGTYNSIFSFSKASPTLMDFLRGTLNDKSIDRWSDSQIIDWAGGRRFNIVSAPDMNETSRAIEFCGKSFNNRFALMSAFANNWEEAVIFLRDEVFFRWVETGLKDFDLFDQLSQNEKSASKADKKILGDSEIVIRTILNTAPFYPFRMKGFASSMDGFPTYLAYAFSYDQKMVANIFLPLFSSGITDSWVSIVKFAKAKKEVTGAWMISRIGEMVRNKAAGFGLERALYEIYPYFPCQSPLVIGKYITSPEMLLLELDEMAKKNKDFAIDRHIIAFLAAKLFLTGPVKIQFLSKYPELHSNASVHFFGIMAAAQEKFGPGKLVNLCTIQAEINNLIIESVHSKTIRKAMQEAVKKSVSDGRLGGVLKTLLNPTFLEEDKKGFYEAKSRYQQYEILSMKLKDKSKLGVLSFKYGLKISVYISYLMTIAAAILLTAQSI